MPPLTEIFDAIIHGLGILSMVAIAFGTFERLPLPELARSLLEGALFGCGAIAAMIAPAVLADGTLVDLRSIIVGLGAAFAGWPGAVVSMLLAGAFRSWLGGPTMIAGVLGICYAAAIGVAWARRMRRPGSVPTAQLLLFGLMLSFHVTFLYGYSSSIVEVTELWLLFSVVCMLATVTLGTLMCRERVFMLRERSLLRDSATDALTGLTNRRAFDKILDQRMADVVLGRRGFSLLILDVDHFKAVNDTHGHKVGDAVLRSLAETLTSSIRMGDVVARIGGEEFGVILRSAHRQDAVREAERLRLRIAGEVIEANGIALRVTASIGVACSADCETSTRELFEEADRALYRAKRDGRNRVVSRSPEIASSGELNQQPVLV